MANKKLLLTLISISCLLCVFTFFNNVFAEDSELPPMVINAGDFPLEQGQVVTMQKTSWGDKKDVTFEVSVVKGTTTVQGSTVQIVKAYDTDGNMEEDYFKKDSSGLMNMGTTREKFNKLVPSLNFQFPLKLNSEWTVFNSTISGKNVLITSKVVSQEFVKVPAGIFQSLKIAVTSGFTDEERVENSYIWVSPGTGIVKEIQQMDENLTQIRELVSFHSGKESFISLASTISAGGNNWNGNGKSIYHAYAKHPEKKDTVEQDIEISYSFTFTIDPQSGFIRGQGTAKIDKFKNTWSSQAINGSNEATFTFIGKKEGDSLKFYDGIMMSNPENFALSKGGEVPLLKILDHAFRISATVSGGKATAGKEIGEKGKSYVKIQWQAGQ